VHFSHLSPTHCPSVPQIPVPQIPFRPSRKYPQIRPVTRNGFDLSLEVIDASGENVKAAHCLDALFFLDLFLPELFIAKK
jgi:hypothetical protein